MNKSLELNFLAHPVRQYRLLILLQTPEVGSKHWNFTNHNHRYFVFVVCETRFPFIVHVWAQAAFGCRQTTALNSHRIDAVVDYRRRPMTSITVDNKAHTSSSRHLGLSTLDRDISPRTLPPHLSPLFPLPTG